MSEQLALLPAYLTAHLQLTLVALLLGGGISVPLGIWISRRPRAEPVVLGVASVIQTIPGLALLAIMVPALAALAALARSAGLELRAIGYGPAIVALTLYSVLPILRNTVTGIAGVDASLREAARGVGMTERQMLLHVELPLAMPVLIAGLRTSAVWVVGTATLSTPVGATSLGNFIFSGLQTRNHAAVLVGCVAAAALALVLDQLIRGLEPDAGRRRRGRVAVSACALAALLVYTAASFVWGAREERELRIGAKTFTEQYVLSEILARTVESQTGLEARPVPSLGSTVAFDALRSGDIDVYVDYSGTIWATIMKREAPADRRRVLDEVTRYLADEHGIAVAGALGFENSYALGMRAEQARELGIHSIADLAAFAARLEIGGDYEFFQRAEWDSLQRAYGLSFARQRSMDPALMYQALAGGEVDVISAFSTDGRIEAHGIELLDDERGAIPPYDAIVLVSPRVQREDPDVIAALQGLAGKIDAGTMRRMNLAVDRDGRPPGAVAEEFLASGTFPAGPRSRRELRSEP